jgi:hypothetical protein
MRWQTCEMGGKSRRSAQRGRPWDLRCQVSSFASRRAHIADERAYERLTNGLRAGPYVRGLCVRASVG